MKGEGVQGRRLVKYKSSYESTTDRKNEAPRSKLWGILRNSLKPLPDPPSPRLRRVLLAFIPVASYGVFGERE